MSRNKRFFQIRILACFMFYIGVGIATGHGPDDRGVEVRVLVEARILSSPSRPDCLWGPSNLLSNGYRGSFHEGKAAGA
jgi:hypothetical protein